MAPPASLRACNVPASLDGIAGPSDIPATATPTARSAPPAPIERFASLRTTRGLYGAECAWSSTKLQYIVVRCIVKHNLLDFGVFLTSVRPAGQVGPLPGSRRHAHAPGGHVKSSASDARREPAHSQLLHHRAHRSREIHARRSAAR